MINDLFFILTVLICHFYILWFFLSYNKYLIICSFLYNTKTIIILQLLEEHFFLCYKETVPVMSTTSIKFIQICCFITCISMIISETTNWNLHFKNPSSRRSITDIDGLLVGHSSRIERPTGCTVILCNTTCVDSVDVRDSAPGTRETDLLDPMNLVIVQY